MSGEYFDPERFRELMELEETVEVLTAEVELRPLRPAPEETAEVEIAEKTVAEPVETEEEPAGGRPEAERDAEPEERPELRSGVKEEPVESDISDRGEAGEELPPEVLSLYVPETGRTEEQASFVDELPAEGERNSAYREWGRRWERESRRYDGGFSLY